MIELALGRGAVSTLIQDLWIKIFKAVASWGVRRRVELAAFQAGSSADKHDEVGVVTAANPSSHVAERSGNAQPIRVGPIGSPAEGGGTYR